MHFFFVIDVCLFDVTRLSNMTMAHSWYCHRYLCLLHQPVALEVRHRGETYEVRHKILKVYRTFVFVLFSNNSTYMKETYRYRSSLITQMQQISVYCPFVSSFDFSLYLLNLKWETLLYYVVYVYTTNSWNCWDNIE